MTELNIWICILLLGIYGILVEWKLRNIEKNQNAIIEHLLNKKRKGDRK